MTEQAEWTLQKIRTAYTENVRLYDVLIAPQSNRKREEETVPDNFDIEGDDFDRKAFFRKMKKVSSRLKAAADQSGNAQTWRAGESLEELSQGMRERIEKALKFGF